MPKAYLNEGATAFAAANWSDATGFAAAAELVIDKGGQTIVTNLDQSSFSIASFDVGPGFSGHIGTDAAGPLIVDVDGGAPNRVTYAAGSGSFRLRAGGNNSLVTDLIIDTGGVAYLQGGTFTNIFLRRGTLFANSSTAITNFYAYGGTSVIDDNATGITLVEIEGGQHVIKRGWTTLNTGGPGVGPVLSWEGVGRTGSTSNIRNGHFRHLAGTPTTVNRFAGVYDASPLLRDATLGTLNDHPAGQSVLNPRGATLTVTTRNQIAGGPSVPASPITLP